MTTSEAEKQDQETAKSSGDFHLQSQSNKFNEKTESVFGCLALLEKKHEAYEKVRSHTENDFMKPDPVMDISIDDRVRNSRGGRGRGRGGRHPRPLPQYRREPRKWTMYDLSDVDNISDRSNKSAALSFLTELRKRKSDSEESESTGPSDEKVVFKKPKSTSKTNQEEAGGSSGSGKLVMPEFNFGAKPAKNKKKREKGAIAAGAGIQLSHLDDEDEDG